MSLLSKPRAGRVDAVQKRRSVVLSGPMPVRRRRTEDHSSRLLGMRPSKELDEDLDDIKSLLEQYVNEEEGGFPFYLIV